MGELVLSAAMGEEERPILLGVDVAIAGGNRSDCGRMDSDGGELDLMDGVERDGDAWRSGEE